MRWLWFVLVFLLGGLVGVFFGGAGGMMAGSVTGTEFGVCATVDVAEKQGILTPEEAQMLLGETASHLRSEFKELVDKAGLSEKLPLNAETCEKLKAEIRQARP
jgi:hypothetical protein